MGNAHIDDLVKLVKTHSLDDFAERLDSSKILRGMLRRIWIPVLCAILCSTAFVYLAHKLASRFVASAYLLYEEDPSKSLTSGVFPLTRISKASAVEMVKLPGNLNAVRSILGLDLTEKEIASLITVVPPGDDSNLINIRVTADTPSLAVDIANTLSTVVVKSAKDYSQRQINTAYEYYKGQYENVQTALGQKIDEITKFQRAHPAFEYGSGGAVAIKTVSDLEMRRQAAVETYNTQLIQYENLKREAEKIPDQVVRYNEVDNPLRQRLGQAELTLIEAKTHYAPENPKIKTLEAEIAQLRKLVQDPEQQKSLYPGSSAEYIKNPLKEQLNFELLGLRGKLRAAQKQKENIEEELQKQSQAISTLPEEQVEYNKLINRQAQIEYDVKQYERMVKTAEALMNLGKSGIEVYQNAEKALPNDSLLVKLLPLIGLFLGSGLGLFIALAVELSDRRLRTPREVESAFHLPCLTTIPEFHLFSRNSGTVQLQYFIRTLEEHLERYTVNSPHFSLTLLSSEKGEGKSTIAYFLAEYYQELGKKTLLIELDGPSKSIETAHSADVKPLEAYLKGEVSADEIILQGTIDRIQAVGDLRLKELLKEERLHHLLEELRDRYPVILLDTPGMIESDYAVNIAEQSDYSLFVLGSSTTPLHTVELCVQDLERHGVHPLGIVLNRALRIYLDDVRIKAEVRRAKVGLFTRIFGRIKQGSQHA